MKKSSKQNKSNRKNSKKQQAKNKRRQQRKTKQKLGEQSADAPLGVDGTTATQKRKALMAQFRQTQWKQKVKAGKASAAKVQKVYNRGG